MPNSSESTKSPSGAKPWLFGRTPDLLLGCGGAYAFVLAALLAGGPSMREWVPMGWLAFALILTSIPHYGATLVRVYEQRESRRHYAMFSIWISLVLAGLFLVACYWHDLGSSLVTLYFNWSPWHYAGQNYGIALMFLRRRGIPISPRAKQLLHGSFILSFLLALIEFNGVAPGAVYALDGDTGGAKTIGASISFLSLGIPGQFQSALMATGLVIYLAMTAGAFVLLNRVGRLSDLGPALMLVLTQSLWFVLPASFRLWELFADTVAFSRVDFRYAFIWVAMGHSLQYLWITTYYSRQQRRERPAYIHYLMCAIFGALIFNVPAFISGSAFLGALGYNDGLTLLIAAVVNIHHFVLDGAIWKLRHGRVSAVLLRSKAVVSETASRAVETAWVRPAVLTLGIACFAFDWAGTWERTFAIPRAREAQDIERLEKAVERLAWLGRDDAANHRMVGLMAVRQQKSDIAVEAFQRSLELDNHPRAWFEIGHIHAKRGEWARTVEAYEEAYAIDSYPEKLIGNLAHALLRADNPTRAREVLRQGLQTHPEHPVLEAQLKNAEERIARRARTGS